VPLSCVGGGSAGPVFSIVTERGKIPWLSWWGGVGAIICVGKKRKKRKKGSALHSTAPVGGRSNLRLYSEGEKKRRRSQSGVLLRRQRGGRSNHWEKNYGGGNRPSRCLLDRGEKRNPRNLSEKEERFREGGTNKNIIRRSHSYEGGEKKNLRRRGEPSIKRRQRQWKHLLRRGKEGEKGRGNPNQPPAVSLYLYRPKGRRGQTGKKFWTAYHGVLS